MRMWMFSPAILCNKHLVAEHVELHMIVGALRKRKKLDGYVTSNAIEPKSIRKRHVAIVKEMKYRGYKHQSALPKFSIAYLPPHVKNAKVNRSKALRLYNTKKHSRDY